MLCPAPQLVIIVVVVVVVAGFIDFIVDPSMQVMGDMLERIVQSSAQQAVPQQTAASDRNGSSKSGDDVAPSAANSGANSGTPMTILPGTVAMHLSIFVSLSLRKEAAHNVVAIYKKAQLSLTNPRDACEKFARFT